MCIDKTKLISLFTAMILTLHFSLFTINISADGTENSTVCQIYSDYLHWDPNKFFDFVWNDTNQIKEDVTSTVHSGSSAKHIKFLGGQAASWVIATDTPVNLSSMGNNGYLSFWINAPVLPANGNTSLTLCLGNLDPNKNSQTFKITDLYTLGSGYKRILIPTSIITGIDWSGFTRIQVSDTANLTADLYFDDILFLKVNPPTNLVRTNSGAYVSLMWNASSTTTDINDASGGVTGYEISCDDVVIGTVNKTGANNYTYSDTAVGKGQHKYSVRTITASGAKSAPVDLNVDVTDKIEGSIKLYQGYGTASQAEVASVSSGKFSIISSGLLNSGVVTAKASVKNMWYEPSKIALIQLLKNDGKTIGACVNEFAAPPQMFTPFDMTTNVNVGTTTANTKTEAFLANNLFEMSETQDTSINTTVVDVLAQKLKISGIAPHGKSGKMITLEVLNPKKNITDITINNSTTATEVFQNYSTGVTEDNGRFNFEFRLNDLGNTSLEDIDNTYKIRIGGEEIVGKLTNTFLFFGAAIKDGLVQSFNQAPNAVEFKKSLNIEKFFSMMVGSDFVLTNEIDKDDILSIMFEMKSTTTVTNAQELTDMIKECTVLAGLNKNIATLFDEGGRLKPEYAKILKLDTLPSYELYKDMSSLAINAVNSSIQGKSLNALSALFDVFNSQCVIYGLKFPALMGYSHVYKIIKDNQSYLTEKGFDVKSYIALTNTEKVDKAIINGVSVNNITIENLATIFNNALKSDPPAKSNNPGGKRGGGVTQTFKNEPVPTVTPYIETKDAPKVDSVPGDFVDLQNVLWAEESINALVKAGIVEGRSKTEFFPDESITREEFIKILVQVLGLKETESSIEFIDVPKDRWSYKFIQMAYENGITKGKDDSYFGAEEKISREDVAVFIVRGINAINANIPALEKERFSDFDQISDYAKPYVSGARNMWIMSGRGNNLFEPKANMTRAEAAKALYNLKSMI